MWKTRRVRRRYGPPAWTSSRAISCSRPSRNSVTTSAPRHPDARIQKRNLGEQSGMGDNNANLARLLGIGGAATGAILAVAELILVPPPHCWWLAPLTLGVGFAAFFISRLRGEAETVAAPAPAPVVIAA